MKRLSNFLIEEDGAITVDWVLLTAGLVALGLLVILALTGGVQHVDTESGNALRGVQVQALSITVPN